MGFDEKKVELLARLQTAAELEIATIPPYLTALLSIKPKQNRGAAENIRSVMMEEMLHLALVANVISSIGGTVRLTDDHVPGYPLTLNFQGHRFKDRQFDVNLAPFSRDAVKTFMAVEQPRKPKALLDVFEARRIDLPGYTIGEFYDSIVALLEELDGMDEGSLFVGDPALQVSEDYYWSAGGKPVLVRDLATAKKALHIVIEQGEGSPETVSDGDAAMFGHPYEVAHYYRFREVFFARRYAATDQPGDDPSGEPLAVDFDAVYPIWSNPRALDYIGTPLAAMNEAFNRQYSRMLAQLEEAFNGNPKVLYHAIMNGMHGLSDLAIRMMQTPVEGDPTGRHGCPSFEWIAP
ncbi:ferritin-like protein [Cupriavidus taiwanensis]|uniref:ferritin-like domain-containing protein n=1 Tax=Cupriavidus taiwanensis TaxID=164546 RepID=UPI0025424A12|nr:ferritin-like protein [Cupriavidus taiwanensis]MDK3025463.1 ferritin-like protein [Cupriavidus taiwanensis]